MAGLVPAIHVLASDAESVDARDEPGMTEFAAKGLIPLAAFRRTLRMTTFSSAVDSSWSWPSRCFRLRGWLLVTFLPPCAPSAACATPRVAPPPMRPSPSRQLLGIVEQPRRQFPVRVHGHGLGAGLILERLRTLRLELRNGRLVSAEEEPGAQRQREVDAVGGNAEPENILRMVTGPKSANRSIRKSRSMAVSHLSPWLSAGAKRRALNRSTCSDRTQKSAAGPGSRAQRA